MSKVLTVKLSDEVYTALQQKASAVGVSVAGLMVNIRLMTIPVSDKLP